MRKLLSKTKKKLRQKLAGDSGTGTSTGGERSDSASSLPRPEPQVAAGGGHDGQDRINPIEEETSSIHLPQPDDPGSLSTAKGENDQEGRNAGAGKRTGGEEPGHVYHPSTLAITSNLKPDGKRTSDFGRLLSLFLQRTYTPPPRLIVNKELFTLMGASKPRPPRMQGDWVGNLLQLLRQNYFFVL